MDHIHSEPAGAGTSFTTPTSSSPSALPSWEAGCWFEGSWRSWQNLDVTLTPSH